MAYDFDQVINRYNSNSLKWDAVGERFGDPDLLPMWVADMDFRAPESVIQALKKVADHGIFGYTIRPDSFYQALMDWMKRRHNWSIEKEWMIFSPGVVPALSMIVEAFTEPEDAVLIQSPVYYPFFHVIRENGRRLVDNSLVFDGNQYRMDFDDLEKKLSEDAVKLMIISSPHNPVGRVWTKDELKKLGELCIKHHVLVVSDEVHCDLILRGNVHTPFASISEAFAENSITCVAPSKTFNLAGLQSSIVIIPNHEHRSTFKRSLRIQDNAMTNSFALAAFEAAYNEGEEWLEQLLDYLENNLRVLNTFFEENLPQINVIQPEGTYLVWIDFRTLGLDAKALETLMQKKAKIALDEGYIFGKAGEGFERINIACPRKTLEDGLQRIKKAVNDHLSQE